VGAVKPRVTVVVVCTPDDEAPDGALMHCMHSVEQQDYPRDLVDTHIVRNVDGSHHRVMERFGVQHADTPLVAFIDVQQVWPAHVLSTLVERLEDCDAFGGTGLDEGAGYGWICTRDYYLKEN
jgi:hypothetical protein